MNRGDFGGRDMCLCVNEYVSMCADSWSLMISMSLPFDSIELNFFSAKFDPSSYKRFIKQYHICLSFVKIKRISLTERIITYDIC